MLKNDTIERKIFEIVTQLFLFVVENKINARFFDLKVTTRRITTYYNLKLA